MIGSIVLHYKIIEKLGEGGMGVVYKAEDTKLEREVAIKFLPKHISSNSEERERFKIEAKAAASLNHPNISTIYSIEEYDSEVFIVMEHIDGVELKDKIKASPILVEEAINIANQIAEGLEAAHKKGIVHRDIKSGNIMITKSGKVKIMDFGLAKVGKGTQLTKIGSTVGTIAYMSPEQAKGDEVDHHTDIWSFGVVLYEMLTGKQPFKGDYDQAVIYSILNEEPENPGNISSELNSIINKALSKELKSRYQTITEMLSDLNEIKSGLSLKTYTHSTKTKSLAKKKSKKWFVPAAIIIFAVLLTTAYLYFNNSSGENETTTERKMIVVLPFENLGSPDDEYFAEGITEEITSRLSEIKQLGVIGRTSANQYKNTNKTLDQIGNELGVNYILEGTVRWEKTASKESRVRVTSQLIKVEDGTHIWTQRYDAILESVFDLQTDIAEKVANAMDVTLLVHEQKSISQKPTDNLEAYDNYLRGNSYYSRSTSETNYNISEQYFLKAIELDPNFAIAYTRLAQINIGMYWQYHDRNKKRLEKAKHYLDKALEISPNSLEIYRAFGQYYYHGFLDYNKALSMLDKALKIKPDDGETFLYIASVKRRQGKFKEAINYFKKSVEMDPLSANFYNLGETYIIVKDYENAEKSLDRGISNTPEWGYPFFAKSKIYLLRNGDFFNAYKILKNSLNVITEEKESVVGQIIQLQIFSGKYDEALKTIEKEPIKVFEDQFEFIPKSKLQAEIYGLMNNKKSEIAFYDLALKEIESKLKEIPDDARLHSALGIVYAGLGKKEEAIKEGKLGVELLPISKEAWRGFFRELDLAKIYTMVGEYDLAINKLDYLLSIPGELSVPYIKIDPVWKPLFNKPHFQKVLEKYK